MDYTGKSKQIMKSGRNRRYYEAIDEEGNVQWIRSDRVKKVKYGKACMYKHTKEYIGTHGMSHTRIYHIWQGIKARCNNPNDTAYKYYGARGITVCKRWDDSFEEFYSDMKDGYTDDLTIDRIDNNRGYSPENCRWVSMYEQQRNKRINHFITIDNVTLCLSDWAVKYNIKPNTVTTRILKYGWDPVDAVTKPIHKTKQWYND